MTATLNMDDPTAAALARAVAGEFQLVREIGRGGMGVVYEAFDERLRRSVAIKTLPPHLAADRMIRERFLREAQTAGSLSHPHIVPIYSAMERDGVVYFVMGLISGESLADCIVRQGALPEARVLTVVRQLASALGYAHSRGIVHRDVKAENVLLDAAGTVFVTDFGIARVAEAQPMTATGTVLGTVHYMSPEQVSGEAFDGRSDLYAVGVLMYYALSGRFPFERATAPAVLIAHVTAVAPSLAGVAHTVSPSTVALVARLLAKQPADRFATTDDLVQALTAPKSVAIASVAPSVVPSVALSISPSLASSDAAPRMASDDAQQVWARAAALQANTGAQAPPPSFGTPAPLVTRGYDANEVRQAAVDAGIPEPYVAQALAERDRQALSAVVVQPGELMRKPPNVFIGAHSKIDLVATVNRELDPVHFEELAEDVRLAMGHLVAISAVGRTLTISTLPGNNNASNGQRAMQISITARNGRTQVRGFEDLTQLTGGIIAGATAGLGVGGGTLAAALAKALTHSPPMIVAALFGMIVTGGSLARYFVGRVSRKRQQELESIMRRVTERVIELTTPSAPTS